MIDKNYTVSKNSLEVLMFHANELFEVATFIQSEYENENKGDFRKEVLSDGVFYRLNKHYQDIYRLINIICNDDKITGECEK